MKREFQSETRKLKVERSKFTSHTIVVGYQQWKWNGLIENLTLLIIQVTVRVPQDCSSISDGIDKVVDGGRVIVSPGIYRESIILSKRVEIVGNGPVQKIVVESREGPAVTVQTSEACLTNLTLMCGRSMKVSPVVLNGCGSLNLDFCDIIGGDYCVQTTNSSFTSIFFSDLHESRKECISVSGQARTIIERCRIHNGLNGVVLQDVGSFCSIRQTAVYHCRQSGVCIMRGGRIVGEGSYFFSNGQLGVCVSGPGSNAVLTHNKFDKNNYIGLAVLDGASAVVEENVFSSNVFGGCFVAKPSSAKVVLSRNTDDSPAPCVVNANEGNQSVQAAV